MEERIRKLENKIRDLEDKIEYLLEKEKEKDGYLCIGCNKKYNYEIPHCYSCNHFICYTCVIFRNDERFCPRKCCNK